jgi:hypothetical protein
MSLGWLLITVVFGKVSSIGCLDQGCKRCQEGFFSYLDKLCIEKCPFGYLTEGSFCVDRKGNKNLFDGRFYNVKNFTDTEASGFKTINGLKFSDSARLTPLPTKERGLYFGKWSVMQKEGREVLGPDFTVSFIIRLSPGCDSDCEIMRIMGNKEFFALRANQSYFISTWLLYDKYKDEFIEYTISSEFIDTYWRLIELSAEQLKTGLVLRQRDNIANSNFVFDYSLTDFELRNQPSVFFYIIGGLINSFQGFLYQVRADNDLRISPKFMMSISPCEFNQFQDSINCLDCDPSLPTWPWCVRNIPFDGTQSYLCSTKGCNKCSGYQKNACNSYVQEDCWKWCDTCSSTFECLECPESLELIEGLCIGKPYKYQPGSVEPVINLKTFKNEEPFCNIFRDYLSKYSVVRTKDRGIYLNFANIKSDENLNLNTKNSIFAWAKSIPGHLNIWNSASIILYSNGKASVLLSDTETWSFYFHMEEAVIDYAWTFYALVNDFSKSSETFSSTLFINGKSVSQIAASGYALFDFSSQKFVYGEGFLYSLKVYNFANYNFEEELHKTVCGARQYESCLSVCEITQYSNGSVCEDCQESCARDCGAKPACLLPTDIRPVVYTG